MALKENAVCFLEPLYEERVIDKLNAALDIIFANKSGERRYADALELYQSGVFNDIVTPKLISLIFSFFPNPVLYHFHSYEITGQQDKPHIAADNFLDGWHRDIDCIYDIKTKGVQHITLFIYLTDVNDGDGAFEICNKNLGFFSRLFKNSNFFRVTGEKGHTFLFNRTAFHRASPNRNSKNRRVLKISFQDKSTVMPPLNVNIKSHEKRFKIHQTMENINKSDIVVRSLFGDKNICNHDVSAKVKEFYYKEALNELVPEHDVLFKCPMNFLQEFRAVAKDIVYLKHLVFSQILRCIKR
ncbi:hypothetical protein HG263_00885 [Pseudoalteromonas sp. JBTF-M23]|uniref:Phytanoyl-CoA dioxygenase PhyH n=1 Tax=Pseudoalteromonas caenipelagi TaxID=2726988 RepID=A0A849V7A7_9GAMM|nr:phytanoyl-CoA dioxygenase family protein [Pseudoalteromonas caenipelagi]NOU49106.1 hypothetical protein [Pseudoalteromonas caenipelagi]